MRKLLMIGLLAGVLAAPSAQAISVSFNPNSNSAVVGGMLTYDVNVSGLGSEFLSSFDITISYNTAILGLSSVTYGAGLDLGVLGDSLQFDSGAVQVTEVSLLGDLALDAGQLNDFLLFTLKFNALSVGSTDLKFDVIDLAGNSNQDPTFGDDIAVSLVDISSQNGLATIRPAGDPGNPVPEPAMPALFGAAFLAMFLNSRRNKG